MVSRADIIENLLYIDNKQGIVQPFRFNKVQRYFNQYKTNRNIVVKARQVGVTTSILADMFIDSITIPHTPCVVVSHETRSTQRLLDRVQFYYDTMEEPKPEIGAESRSEKTFPGMHSSIYVGTAGSRAFGRGDTIRKALLSEIAYYEDGGRLLNGVEDSVPLTGELTLETTPNGETNIAYEVWVRAREGKSPYKAFFFPWWLDEGYRIPRLSDIALPGDEEELTYTGEEQELVERVHLSEDQIRWRRWKISEKKGLFFQEYPEDEINCFLVSGDPVFDQLLLSAFAQVCYEGEHHTGGWDFWIPPQEKMRYIIGVDTSSGAPEGSYSAAVVLDDLWRVCATYQARVEPHIFAGILRNMGVWYNKAELAIERNFTGYAVLGELTDYSNISHQRDFTTGKVTSQRGWWTNDQTRSFMMTIARENLERAKIWNVNLVRQLRGYKYMRLKTKWREEAQTFDDLAMAFMIAMTVRRTAGTSRGYIGKVPGWNWN